jgi:hypothetical protein
VIRQYFTYRRPGGCNPLGVVVIPVGAIFYIQDEGWWRDRYRGAPICRDPWIVEAFLNGTLAAAHRNADRGRWEDVTMARRANMAIVRSLRDGRRRTIAVRVLVLHEDVGLRQDPATYPDLPNASHGTRPARLARSVNIGAPARRRRKRQDVVDDHINEDTCSTRSRDRSPSGDARNRTCG